MPYPDFRNEHQVARRPHHIVPALASVRVIMVYQTYPSVPGTCDAGLSNTVLSTMRVLRQAGVHCESWGIRHVGELYVRLVADEDARPARPITHVVINTPSFVWPLPTRETPTPESIIEFASRWQEIIFVQLNHSGMAFLSIDLFGVKHIREALDLSVRLHNVAVAGNNSRFVRWTSEGLKKQSVLLPNLYDMAGAVNPVMPYPNPNPIRVGAFGAGRPWKNPLVAGEAALVIGNRLRVPVELNINSGRWDGDGGLNLAAALDELYANLAGATLIKVPWQSEPAFLHTVSTVDVLLNISFDETFCAIVANGCWAGTPSVVGPAIEWAPKSWMCWNPEDPGEVARVAIGLLHDRVGAVHDGREALSRYVNAGVTRWIDYLTGG